MAGHFFGVVMWRHGGPRNLPKENRISMGLIDYVMAAYFRDEKSGRVVVFPGDRRSRGYLIRSQAQESQIRSFLKMFFFAHILILILGNFLATEWSRELNHAVGRPVLHLYRAMGNAAVIYSIVVGIPYLLLWRSYKKARVSFTSAQDEVLVSGKPPGQQTRILIAAGLIAAGVIMAFALFLLTRAK
jgi:hypothetical protein